MNAKAYPPIKLIAGLGNPGAEYEQTRHNAGQTFVEELAIKYAAPLTLQSKHKAYTSKALIGDQSVHLVVPTTFMNLSGYAIASLASFYKILPEEILVAHDELDLPCGRVRFKNGGGHGGHNGLRDTIQKLANQNGFARLRIGIDHPGHAKQVASYVLKRAPKEQYEKTEQAMQAALADTEIFVAGDREGAMRTLHSAT